jgi:hypothetical protein
MIKNLLKRNFSTTVDVLSTKNLKKFGCKDYPQSLNYSRPFRTVDMKKDVSKTSNGITVAS